MEKKVKVFIDTDVFVIERRYKRDAKYRETTRFLEKAVKDEMIAYTSIYNLLEFCGILSFNLSYENTVMLYLGFATKYNTTILFPDEDAKLVCFNAKSILDLIKQKMSFGDALVISIVDKNKKIIDTFVTWNVEHFKDKLGIAVLNPSEVIS
jgi:hypothetical protein